MPDHGYHGVRELDLFSWGAGEREPVPEPPEPEPEPEPQPEVADDDLPIYPAAVAVPAPAEPAVDVVPDPAPTNGAYAGGTGVEALDAVQGHLLPELAIATSSLAARLIVPPFSILDTTAAYWQQRKRGWVGLGIKSELGRAGDLLVGGGGGLYGGSTDYAAAAVVASNGAATTTSIFDPVLCEVAYRWWCPEGGVVLDPFAGGSVRGVVAAVLGRGYLGVDLSERQVEANRANWAELDAEAGEPAPQRPQWTVGDSTKLYGLLGSARDNMRFDMLFTCPPYWNLEVYSEDAADLSNAKDWERFSILYRQVIADALGYLKPNRFSVWVVGNLRGAKGELLDLGGLTTRAHEQAGCALYNDAILATAFGTLPMRTASHFPKARKLGRRHQQVLVYWKGDPSKVQEAMGPVQGWVPSELTG